MRLPILIINMKVYPEVLGKKALELAKVAESVARELGVSIAVAPPITELRTVAEGVEIPVYAQGADPVEPGARTGHVPLEFIKEAGAVGVILNHSENRLLLNDLGWLVSRARSLGLETLVCAPDPYTSAAAAALEPTAVAVEPPELIGTGKAVSREKPDVIVRTVELVRKVNPSIPVITGPALRALTMLRRPLNLGHREYWLPVPLLRRGIGSKKITELANALR